MAARGDAGARARGSSSPLACSAVGATPAPRALTPHHAPQDTFRKQLVGIKGPLTTPVGGGIRSLNVALRQELDLYVCLRPVRWFTGAGARASRCGSAAH